MEVEVEGWISVLLAEEMMDAPRERGRWVAWERAARRR